MLKVIPVRNEFGNVVKNQYTYWDGQDFVFQSYDDIVVRQTPDQIYLDQNAYNASVTTRKYRNQFLNMTDAEVSEAIQTNDLVLMDLNL